MAPSCCSSWLQPFYSYPSDLEAPEAFDESISDWNFYVALKECLSKIGVNNFRWKVCCKAKVLPDVHQQTDLSADTNRSTATI